MDSTLYNQIIDEYHQMRFSKPPVHLITDMRVVLRKLIDKFAGAKTNQVVNQDVIISIISYKCQQEQKELSRFIDWNMVFNDYSNGVGMLSIAATANLSPALVSQRIVNHIYSSTIPQSQLKECQFNSNQIDNCCLAFESMLAHYSDPFYGIHYTQSSNNSGQVFEQYVECYLKEAGVDFMNEIELRKKKYDVTPDFKLNIPVVLERHWISVDDKKCVKNFLITKPIEFLPLKADSSLQSSDNPAAFIDEEKNITREVINWIECKSLFANEQCHREYTQNQYNSYVNRFGRGMVIYNFGCIDTILDDEEAKFVTLVQLPELK